MDHTDQTAASASSTLDVRVMQSLRTCYETLLKRGELLTKERLSECYALFRERFGPDKLQSLDGEILLNTIHGRSEEKDSLVYWLEFKNDADFNTRNFGSIKGGNSLKFGIAKKKDTGEWTTGNAINPTILTIEEAIKIAQGHRDQLLAAVMHSTSIWTSLSERCSGLPCMRWPRWPLQRLQRLLVIFAPVLLLSVGEQRGRRKQWRRVRQQRKAEMVASRFVRDLHACRGANTHAVP